MAFKRALIIRYYFLLFSIKSCRTGPNRINLYFCNNNKNKTMIMYTNTNAFLKIFILTEINFMTKKIVFPKLSWKFVVTGTLLIHEKINNQR